mgnify:CR=1 FL=1
MLAPLVPRLGTTTLTFQVAVSDAAPATSTINYLPKDRTLGFLLNPDPDDPVYQQKPASFRECGLS